MSTWSHLISSAKINESREPLTEQLLGERSAEEDNPRISSLYHTLTSAEQTAKSGVHVRRLEFAYNLFRWSMGRLDVIQCSLVVPIFQRWRRALVRSSKHQNTNSGRGDGRTVAVKIYE